MSDIEKAEMLGRTDSFASSKSLVRKSSTMRTHMTMASVRSEEREYQLQPTLPIQNNEAADYIRAYKIHMQSKWMNPESYDDGKLQRKASIRSVKSQRKFR